MKKPIKHKYIKTDFKCPKCGWECLYNVNLNVYACNRPIIDVKGNFKGSCGKFYDNGERFK